LLPLWRSCLNPLSRPRQGVIGPSRLTPLLVMSEAAMLMKGGCRRIRYRITSHAQRPHKHGNAAEAER
jgi:hypothetical protein